MMAQIRDCGDGIRGGTYTMTAPVITGGSITGVTSLSTTGNTTLGDASTDTLNVGNGGLVKDASGNVGIGTSSPSYPLDVLSNSSAIGVSIRGRSADNVSLYNFTSNNGATQYGYVLGSLAELRLAQNGANYITAFTNGSERMRITSAGNVGIGLTNPSAPLNPAASNQTDNTKAALFVSDGTTTTKGVAVGYNSTPNYGFIQSVNKGVVYTFLSLQPEGANVLVGTTTNNGSGGTLQISNGITFPATQSAVADANTLDDYEEGTWLPNVGGTATYGIQTGRYTKVGNVVTVMFDMNISSIGTGSTGTMFGLPFTSLVTTAGTVTYYETLNISYTFISCYAGAGGTQVTLTGNNATAAASIAFNGGAAYQNNSRVIGSITYIVS
jgi:hypothetical protein